MNLKAVWEAMRSVFLLFTRKGRLGRLIIKFIIRFDRKIFPENPLSRFTSAKMIQDFGINNFQAAYVIFIEGREAYSVKFDNLVVYFGKIGTFAEKYGKKHGKRNIDVNRFVALGIAAHEVRHRVQNGLNVRLITRRDCETVQDEKIRTGILFVDEFKLDYPIVGEYLVPREYDALVISWAVRIDYLEKNKIDEEEIVRLIKFSLY